MNKVVELKHPLIEHKLTLMRMQETGKRDFRDLLNEITKLMVFEATKDLPMKEVQITTPVSDMTGRVIDGKKLVIVPILRAGIGMVDGFIDIIPNAKVGHVGLYRDEETCKPIEYYCKLPQKLEERDVIVVDPMLATGGSAVAAIDIIKQKGAKSVRMVNLVAAPEGIAEVHKHHPEVDIYTAVIDEKLNENKYIVPGLGDAGDRLFGTK